MGYPNKLVGYQFTKDDLDKLIAVIRELDLFPEGSGFLKGQHHLVRNHPRLVAHIPEILQVWRGNTDAQIVKSVQQLLEYLLKYMLKPEVSSEAFSNVVKSITNNFDEDSPVRKLFGSLLMKTLSEHDYSRTEAFKIFSPEPFVLMSRQLRSVNVLGTREVDTTTTSDDRRAVRDNIADKYWHREDSDHYKQFVTNFESKEVDYPRHPSEVSLYQFVGNFTENWQLTGKLYVPNCTPNFRYPPKKTKKDYRLVYCRTMLLLHKPGTSPDTLSDDLESELAEFVETTLCPRMLRLDYLKSLEEDEPDAPEHEPLQPSPLDRPTAPVDQDDFMIALGGEVVQDTINDATDVDDTTVVQNEPDGDHDNLVTANVDWEADSRLLNFTAQDIKENADWIERMRVEVVIPVETDVVHSPDSLNEEQRKVFDQFSPYFGAVAQDIELPNGRLMDLSGAAGTGKTRVIKTIMQYGENMTDKTNAARVMAYTNSAVKHFPGGQTIHKTLRIPVHPSGSESQFKSDLADLAGDQLKKLQFEMEDTVAIIIDEKSMVGQWMLYAIDRRCRQAKPKYKDIAFGNLTILLAGEREFCTVLIYICRLPSIPIQVHCFK